MSEAILVGIIAGYVVFVGAAVLWLNRKGKKDKEGKEEDAYPSYLEGCDKH